MRRERPPDHADIRKKMHESAEKRRLFGYRRGGKQTRIAQTILARRADYLLALKDNQKSLATEVALFFDLPEQRGAAHMTTDGDHGRIETRSHWVSTGVDWLQSAYSTEGGHRFHAIAGTHSTASRAVVPRDRGQLI